ncbi:MAG: helix-turn-helix transcriptional regulator [Clostridium sp.]|nr:helix-turn-helix transcriptional regulator [Clostridium sp.]
MQATDELKSTLTRQSFHSGREEEELVLEEYKRLAENYVKLDGTIVVLSDFRTNSCYLYAGRYGRRFGIPQVDASQESAFEECIFSQVHPDDLRERHLLELSYFRFQQGVPVSSRERYYAVCQVRIRDVDGEYRRVTHRTCYVASHTNGSVWLALCFYAPSSAAGRDGIEGRVMDGVTGDVIMDKESCHYRHTGLSGREIDVLRSIARGRSSKEIAEELHIALYTVYRHRQNIIRKLQVTNTAQAVQIALVVGLI